MYQKQLTKQASHIKYLDKQITKLRFTFKTIH